MRPALARAAGRAVVARFAGLRSAVTKYIAYGPTNRQAHQYVRPEDAVKLPSTPAYFANGFDQDGEWWAENLPKVTERWQTWVLQ